MKNIIWMVILVMLTISTPAIVYSAWWNPLSWLSSGSLKVDVKTMKDSVDKNFSDIKAGINDNTLKMSALSDNVVKMDNAIYTVGNEVGVVKDNQVKLQASVAAGYQTTATTVGGNQAITSTNDTGLMKYAFHILSAIFFAIITALGTIIRSQGMTINRLNDQSDKLQHERDDQYAKLVNKQTEMLDALMQDKNEYKAKYLRLVEAKK